MENSSQKVVWCFVAGIVWGIFMVVLSIVYNYQITQEWASYNVATWALVGLLGVSEMQWYLLTKIAGGLMIGVASAIPILIATTIL